MKQFKKLNVIFLVSLAACNQNGNNEAANEEYHAEQAAKVAQEVAAEEQHAQGITGAQIAKYVVGVTALGAAAGVGAYYYGDTAASAVKSQLSHYFSGEAAQEEVAFENTCVAEAYPGDAYHNGVCFASERPSPVNNEGVHELNAEGFSFTNGTDSDFWNKTWYGSNNG